MISAIGGVPASNFHGTSLVVKPSRRTSLIISPPPRNGGMASRISRRPQSTPMPVGPHILWPLNANRSAPSSWTSVARWGTYWQASTHTVAPAAWAASAMRRTGVERAEHVGHRADRRPSWRRRRSGRGRRGRAAVVAQRDPAQLDVALGLEHVPRHDVGVVLHLGEHDGVARLEVGAAPRMGDEVERLGGVLGEHDLVCSRRR